MTRPLLIGDFDDLSGFAFNPENPSGVKYLHSEPVRELKALLQRYGSPPVIPRGSREFVNASSFVTHGLASYEDDAVVSPKSTQIGRALTVWLHVSNACNLSCGYCYIPGLRKAATSGIAQHLMTPSLAHRAVEELLELCRENGFRRLQIKFAGGEPTLNEPVVMGVCEAAEKAREYSDIGIDLRMLTNGVFDSSYWIPIFKRHRIGVSISVDGAPAEHDQTRFTAHRVPSAPNSKSRIMRLGTWETVNKTISDMLSAGIKPYLLCTVTPKNIFSIREFVSYCQSNVVGFRLSPVRDNRSFAEPSVSEMMTDTLCAIYEDMGKHYPINMPIERFARFAEWNLNVKKDLACGSCRSTLSIDQVGRVASCQMRMNVPFGGIGTTTVSHAFHKIQLAPENKPLVTPGRKTGDCIACKWRYSCAGGCPEHTRDVFATADHSSPWCRLYGTLMPIYIRAIAQQLKRAVDHVHGNELARRHAKQSAPADRFASASLQ